MKYVPTAFAQFMDTYLQNGDCPRSRIWSTKHGLV
jgi:hypothetical protein